MVEDSQTTLKEAYELFKGRMEEKKDKLMSQAKLRQERKKSGSPFRHFNPVSSDESVSKIVLIYPEHMQSAKSSDEDRNGDNRSNGGGGDDDD